MKKYSLLALIAFAMMFCVSFFAGCSDSTAMGTSEEGNELAENVSSSSDDDSSSSQKKSSSSKKAPVESMSSSSSDASSSDSADLLIKSCSSRLGSSTSTKRSSSSRVVSSSSAKQSGSSIAESSSSEDKNVHAPEITSSSSSRESANDGAAQPNSLTNYLNLLNLDSESIDNAVLSAKIDRKNDSYSQNPDEPPLEMSEFDGIWPHKVVKQNVGSLEMLFPTAVQDFPDVINAIKNETLDEKCGLYTFNVYGDGISAAYVIAEISKESIKVLDVPAGECNVASAKEIYRFLFYYCGELVEQPKVVHVAAETSLSKCPAYKTGSEWVKVQPPTPSRKNL